MKIVVLCDRWREEEIPKEIVFDEIGKECINKINGEYIKQKYNIKEMKDIGDLLRKERIEWIKKNVKRD